MAATERLRYTVVLEDGGDGWITVHCPALPGCVSQGRTRQEALTNIREAIEPYVESLREHGEPVPREDRDRRSQRLMPDLPALSGDRFVRAVAALGCEITRIRGGHMVLRRSGAPQLVVPRHREPARGTLRILIKDAGLSVDEFVELLAKS